MNNKVNKQSVRAFIALGSNLGNPIQQMDTAILAIASYAEIKRIKLGKVYQTKPHGPQNQGDFINSVLAIRTSLSPENLLSVLQTIEQQQGRKRLQHWGPRTIDLDIILYEEMTYNTKNLSIPHPRIGEREFVLMPLCDIDSSIVIPQQGRVADLLANFTPDTINAMKIIRNVTTYND